MQRSFGRKLAVDVRDLNPAEEWEHGITNGVSLYECCKRESGFAYESLGWLLSSG